jgi:hypothetical protein
MRFLTFITLVHMLSLNSVDAQSTYDASFVGYTGLRYVCDDGFTPVVRIQNMGTATMSTCVVETWKGGIMVNTFDWELAVPAQTGDIRQPALPEIPDAEAGEIYEFRIISVNDELDEGSDGNVLSMQLDDQPEVAQDEQVNVLVVTGMVPSEYVWTIKDELGQVAATGGPYNTVSTPHETTVDLDPFACYQFIVDGEIDPSDMSASITLHSNAEVVIMLAAAQYDGFAKGFRTNGTIGLDEIEESMIEVMFDASISGYVVRSRLPLRSVELLDLSGRSMKQWQGTAMQIGIPGGTVTPGVYLLSATSANGVLCSRRIVMQ